MPDNIVSTKSKVFAIRIVNLYKFLCDSKQEYVMSKQLLRCGTSIGANVTEAFHAISKKRVHRQTQHLAQRSF
jgi:four helix bundle protein